MRAGDDCHHHDVILVGRGQKVKSHSGVLVFIIYGMQSPPLDTKLVVDGNEGAYVICTSSPLVESCFIPSQLSCITQPCSKTLSPDPRTTDLGMMTHILRVILQDFNEGENINQVGSHPVCLQYSLDMNRRGGILSGHGQMRWCTVWTCAEEVVY